MSRDATVSLRRLTSSDVAQLCALNRLFADAFNDPASYLHSPPDDAYLAGVLAKEHVIVIVALLAGSVVGGLVAYELDKLERARREVYIYDLAVAAPHRRQGIATALIESLRQIAAQRAAWVIYVQADHGDEPAIALYESLGVREDVMHFDIPVMRRPPA
jgi:aminoglycoside 3-N-acetyltransferase I